MRLTDIEKRPTKELRGVGLHRGVPCGVRVHLGAPGSGLQFRRLDLPDAAPLSCHPKDVTGVDRCTRLGARETGVYTIEHLLAALSAAGIWDAVIDVDGGEVPIVDGSARPFWDLIDDLRNPPPVAPAAFSPPPCALCVSDSKYRVTPARTLHLAVTFRHAHRMIGTQHAAFTIDPAVFDRELAEARTFGFLAEAQSLRDRGLARGADTTNCIVLGDEGPVGTSLQWPDEFVRHKMVDLLGDLALIGRPLGAHIEAHQPSHRGNVALARLLADHLRGTEEAA